MADNNELRALRYLNDYAQALSTDDFHDDDVAENGFLDSIDSVKQPKRNELNALYAQLKSNSKGDVFLAYSDAAKRLGALKKEFELGKIKASNAQASLFFPALAKELKTVAESLAALKKATDEMLADLDNARQALNSGDVKALIDEASASKDSLDNVIEALTSLKAGA